MSYQVLARKWRPATFKEMVGQEHVLKALVNALDSGRLHHAYLFTGTRGVGKTSIARLFAKALNCEAGVSSEPCGQCSACQAIAEGRFVDLIEVDAASRTKVEDTRELLENVQYAPTQGRYKVYLIDEVHMLSTHSFNALLKTLEEPPPHIKFLLATTDPQKLPVTILSRCLQFNLKNMSPERVVEHLNHVLDAEKVPFDESALWLLGRAANGSMRDALSLADQAISYGDGQVKDTDVRAMLGSVDHQQTLELLSAVAANDASQVMQKIAQMAEYGVDCDDILAAMVSLLHRVAVGQILPNSVDNSLGDQVEIKELAKSMKAEDVQLFYQIALNGRKDLPIVPVPREGLEMTMLRMLAFRPVLPGEQVYPDLDVTDTTSSRQESPANQSVTSVEAAVMTPTAELKVVTEPVLENHEPEPSYQSYAPAENQQTKAVQDEPPWATDEPPPLHSVEATVKKPETPEEEASVSGEPLAPLEVPITIMPSPSESEAEVLTEGVKEELAENLDESPLLQKLESGFKQTLESEPKLVSEAEKIALNELDATQWISVIDVIGISGMTYNIAANMSVLGASAGQVSFVIASEQQHLVNDVHRERIETSLSAYFNEKVNIDIQAGVATEETPGQFQQRRQQERLAEAHEAIENDENVQLLIARYDARIDKSSVKPL